MTIKDYIKQTNTVTYELCSLQNYTDANTVSLYDSKIMVKEYEIINTVYVIDSTVIRPPYILSLLQTVFVQHTTLDADAWSNRVFVL